MILLAGYGYVGKAIHETFRDVVDMHVVDPKHNKNKVTDFIPDKVIIAVSTPEGKNGECDMTNVFDVLKKVNAEVPVLIKSTISSIVILPSNIFLSSTTGIASRSYFCIILATLSASSLTFTESTFGI